MRLTPYRKALVAGVAALVITLQQVFGIGDGVTLFGVPAEQAADAIIAICGAVGVFWFRNEA